MSSLREVRDGDPVSRAHRARARGAAARGRGQAEQGDRRRAGHQRADGADTRIEHPPQARPQLAHPGRALGGSRGPRGRGARSALTLQAAVGCESESGRAVASSRREWIPSLANTLRRCHSTVRGLRKSRAPISGFESPSRASCAICRSCAVSSSRVSTRPLAHLLARRQQLAPGALGERLHADRGELVVGGAELRARVDPPVLAAQPLAVEQVRAGELRAQPRAAQPLDRLAVQALGALALAQQRARAGPDAERPVGAATAVASAMRSRAPRARAPSRRSSSPPRAARSPPTRTTNSSGVSSLGVLRRRQRLLIAAEAVEEHRRAPSARTGPRSPGRRRCTPRWSRRSAAEASASRP